MGVRWAVESIVVQPTTFCNINCSYCYLSGRDKARRMEPKTARNIAQALEVSDSMVNILWHGGEPLSTGLAHLQSLVAEFKSLLNNGLVRHAVQTNCILVDEGWCDFFLENKFEVSISVDGPARANARRVDWKNRETFDRVLRGARCLDDAGIPFSVICVVGRQMLEEPEELYNFFVEMDCVSVGFNIEEKLGANQRHASDDGWLVSRFWERLFVAWSRNPAIRVREFDDALSWICMVSDGGVRSNGVYDLFPTISWDGHVVVLAPELLDASSTRYVDFVVGDVNHEGLSDILGRAVKADYVLDYELGVSDCQASCDYFDFCCGGVGSNKFFELGTTGGTETVHCRNREQRMLDSVIKVLERR